MLSSNLSQVLFYRPKGRLTNYVISLIAVGTAIAIQFLFLGSTTDYQNTLLLLYTAVLMSALAGGIYSGLGTIAASLLFIMLWEVVKGGGAGIEEEFQLLLFIILSVLTSYIIFVVKSAYQISLSILNGLHSFIVILDPFGKVMDMNQSVVTVLNINREEMIGKHLLSQKVWNYSTTTKHQLERALKEARVGKKSRFDIKINSAITGKTMYLDLTLFPIFDRQQNVIYIVASASDVTQRIKAESDVLKLNTSLQQRINELQVLFDLLPVGIGITHDRQAKDIRINASFARMLGLESQANASLTAPISERPKNFKVLQDNRELKPRQLPMQIAARSGKTIKDFEVELVRDDGTHLRLLEYAQPLLNERGNVSGSVGAFVDITQLSTIEERLEESERRFKALLGSNLIGVIVVTLDGKIIEANEAFCTMVGYSQEEVRSGAVSWKSMTPPEFEAKDKAVVEELRKKGEHAPFEKEYLRKDGTRLPVLVGATMVETDQNVAVAFILDITARKRLEKRKDEFIGLASHELKTPVTSIKVYTQLLERTLSQRQDVTNLQYVKKMNSQIDRLTSLVEELLDVSKIEAGKLTLQFEDFDFNVLLRDTVSELQAISPKHELKLSGTVAKPLFGDQYRLKQVLINILTNAIKYSPDAEKVEITLSENQDSVTLQVRDFGVGIPKIDQQRIFEKFVRARGKNLHSFPGLGLGLYLSKQIIERHGGSITVQSVENQGSTFIITLPFKR